MKTCDNSTQISQLMHDLYRNEPREADTDKFSNDQRVN